MLGGLTVVRDDGKSQHLWRRRIGRVSVRHDGMMTSTFAAVAEWISVQGTTFGRVQPGILWVRLTRRRAVVCQWSGWKRGCGVVRGEKQATDGRMLHVVRKPAQCSPRA